MAKKKTLQDGPKPRGSAPTRTIKRLRTGDTIYLPSDTATVLVKEPLAKRIPTKRKELQVVRLVITSGAAKGKEVEFVYSMEDKVELKTTPLRNRLLNWLRKLRKWQPFG